MSKEYNRYQEGLIKSILARPEEIANVVDYIDSRDFDNINFKLVYEAILELHLEKANFFTGNYLKNWGTRWGN